MGGACYALELQNEIGKPLADLTAADILDWVKRNAPFDRMATGKSLREIDKVEQRRNEWRTRKAERDAAAEERFRIKYGEISNTPSL